MILSSLDYRPLTQNVTQNLSIWPNWLFPGFWWPLSWVYKEMQDIRSNFLTKDPQTPCFMSPLFSNQSYTFNRVKADNLACSLSQILVVVQSTCGAWEVESDLKISQSARQLHLVNWILLAGDTPKRHLPKINTESLWSAEMSGSLWYNGSFCSQN